MDSLKGNKWKEKNPAPAPPPKTRGTTPKAGAPTDVHLRSGVEKLKAGDTQAAIADFTRAIEADPTCAQAYANRGVARERAGDIAGAKADYSKSIQIEFDKGLQREISK